MIVVSVELWPFGLKEGRKLLADAKIENRGLQKEGYCYRAQLRERADADLDIKDRNQTIHISGYDRRQSVWNLVLRVLGAAWFEHELESLANLQRSRAWVEDSVADSEALALFLDLLPSGWGLTEHQVEQLLNVRPGWLRAWRNHEVHLDSTVRSRIWQLGLLQKRMRIMSKPESYSTFWHRAWGERSPLGNRSPWQAFEQEGDEAIRKIQHFLESGRQ